jgi:hypothetical protein
MLTVLLRQQHPSSEVLMAMASEERKLIERFAVVFQQMTTDSRAT